MQGLERVRRAIYFQSPDRIPHYLPDGQPNDIVWLWPPRPITGQKLGCGAVDFPDMPLGIGHDVAFGGVFEQFLVALIAGGCLVEDSRTQNRSVHKSTPHANTHTYDSSVSRRAMGKRRSDIYCSPMVVVRYCGQRMADLRNWMGNAPCLKNTRGGPGHFAGPSSSPSVSRMHL
jgi:hypothetical protein